MLGALSRVGFASVIVYHGVMARVVAVLSLLLGGCVSTGDDPCLLPAYAVEVQVRVGADVGARGAVVHWADQAPADGVVAPPTSAVLALRRAFATRAEAESFRVPFVVLVGGVERGRDEVDFTACDRLVAEIGHDPAERRLAIFWYALDFDGNIDPSSPPNVVSCQRDTTVPNQFDRLVGPCPLTERHLVYRLPLPTRVLPTRVTADGADLVPRTIWASGEGIVLELDIESSLDTAVADVMPTLGLELSGAAVGTFAAAYDPCIQVSLQEGKDPDTLLYQQRTLDAATLQIDEGYYCYWSDGTGTSRIP